MKKKLSAIYCAVFFAVISLPLALMPLAQDANTENRALAPAPGLIADGEFNLSFPAQTEEFFKDRFAGRTQMIDAYSRLLGSVFGVSANGKVVMGTDGFLFFGETIGDFDGGGALDDTQMDALVQILLGMKQSAEARGQVFIIAIAPNKNTVCGEYMPPQYKRTSDPTNLDRLLAYDKLECLDLRSALTAAGEMTYHKTDSHWNGLGARIAAREIMLAIEEKTGIRADFDWDGGAFEVRHITGDLGQMLYPASPPKEADRFYEDSQPGYTAIGRYRNLDDLHITTESDGVPLRVAMYRDSFANSLIPYFSNAYGNVYYTRQTPPPTSRAEFLEADVIVFQIAERRLGELLVGKP